MKKAIHYSFISNFRPAFRHPGSLAHPIPLTFPAFFDDDLLRGLSPRLSPGDSCDPRACLLRMVASDWDFLFSHRSL